MPTLTDLYDADMRVPTRWSPVWPKTKSSRIR